MDDFDQDHALILTEGTNVGIFQSIMMKPPNVQPIYPIRDESNKEILPINPENTGPIIIFNVEMFDHKSILKIGEYTWVKKIFSQLKELESTIGPDFDLVVILNVFRR
jgi:hypothetical protein